MTWTRVETELPPEDEIVMTIAPDGREVELVLYRNLWFFPDKSMYVYYVPKFWRKREEG